MICAAKSCNRSRQRGVSSKNHSTASLLPKHGRVERYEPVPCTEQCTHVCLVDRLICEDDQAAGGSAGSRGSNEPTGLTPPQGARFQRPARQDRVLLALANLTRVCRRARRGLRGRQGCQDGKQNRRRKHWSGRGKRRETRRKTSRRRQVKGARPCWGGSMPSQTSGRTWCACIAASLICT